MFGWLQRPGEIRVAADAEVRHHVVRLFFYPRSCACSQLVTTSFDGSVVRWEPSRQGDDDDERDVSGSSKSGVRRRRRLQTLDADMYADDF